MTIPATPPPDPGEARSRSDARPSPARPLRWRIEACHGWKFVRCEDGGQSDFSGLAVADGDWETVFLPHTVRLEPAAVQFPFQGVCWYRRHFPAEPAWLGRRVVLEFGAGTQIADVWVDGTHRFRHLGGYLPFSIDLSDSLGQERPARIAVRLDNRNTDLCPPGKPLAELDFSYFGGLYRGAQISVTNDLHVSDPLRACQEAGGGVFIRCEDASPRAATVQIKTHAWNAAALPKRRCRLVSEIYSPEGALLAAAESFPLMIGAGEGHHFLQSIPLEAPSLWHPDHPYLHTLVSRLYCDGVQTDELRTRFGVRHVAMGTRFLLNGEPFLVPAAPETHDWPVDPLPSSQAPATHLPNLVEIGPDKRTFFLHSKGATYALSTARHGVATHLHWGAAIATQALDDLAVSRSRPFSANPVEGDADFSLDSLPLEYPTYGNSDFRAPALEILDPAVGSRLVRLRYTGHRILAGKPPLPGLPASFANEEADAQTLVLTLRDEAAGLSVELGYTAFRNHPVIARSVRIVNEGGAPVVLKRILSCSVDFPARISRFHFVHLHGAWARETQVAVHPLRPGGQRVESRRGASSHAHNPFFALTELGDDEEHGEVFGFNLVYSGNFLSSVDVDHDGSPRVQNGINPFDFSWQLDPHESFQAPEALMVYSQEGLGGMSRSFHRFQRAHLLPPRWRERPRPILINNWEATYFDFNADKIEALAADAGELGVELFVLDDGWFGQRDDDQTSLGDWTPHRTKLPDGLPDLVERVRRHGLEFGLWFEPEMISPDSDFYREHPDWCLHVRDRPRTRSAAASTSPTFPVRRCARKSTGASRLSCTARRSPT